MKPKRPTNGTVSTLSARSPNQLKEDAAKLANFVTLIDQDNLRNLVSQFLCESAVSQTESAMSDVKEMLIEVAASAEDFKDVSFDQLRKEVESVVNEPILQPAHLDEEFIKEEAEAVAWATARHCINQLIGALIFATSGQCALNELLQPVRPAHANIEAWEEWQNRMTKSLDLVLSDYSFKRTDYDKVVRNLSQAIDAHIASKQILELPERVQIRSLGGTLVAAHVGTTLLVRAAPLSVNAASTAGSRT